MDTPANSPDDRRRDPAADAAVAEAVDTPTGTQGLSTPPQEPTGHYGPGYGDTTPVDPAADPEDPDTAFARWREARLREMDEDYAAWRETGAGEFPDDFDDWRRAHRRTMSETEKAQLLFERS